MGVENIKVKNISSLNPDFLQSLRQIKPIKLSIKQNHLLSETTETVQDRSIYFSNQVFDSAHFLNSLLHILFNCEQLDSSNLGQLRHLALEHTLIKSPLFRESYNNLINSIPQYADQSYHSISFVYCQGKLWELDALKNGPRIVSSCNESNWLECMQEELFNKFEIYQRHDVPISVCAIMENRKLVYQKKLIGTLFMKQEIEKILCKERPDWRYVTRNWEEEYRYVLCSNNQYKRGLLLSRKLLSYCKSFEQLSLEEQQRIQHVLSSQQENPMDFWLQIHDNALRLYESLGLEDEKEEMDEKNDIRRKHNYIPFIKSFIQALHDEGHLGSLSL
ncbi:unnamed protein product [Rhizopus stolonifer]